MRAHILSLLSALTLAGGLAGAAHADSGAVQPAAPAGSTEISGTLVWHQRGAAGTVSALVSTGSGDVLVRIHPGTPIYRKYWGHSDPSALRTADALNVWGSFRAGSDNLVMTAAMVQDASIQKALAEATGNVLFRADGFVFVQVISKPNGSPIGSVLIADHNRQTRVLLPDGQRGTWQDIKRGQTVDVAGTYDNASAAMVDTDHVQIRA